MIGDINIDVLKNTNDTDHFLDMIGANGLQNPNESEATRVDLSRNCDAPKISDILGTSHFLIFLIFSHFIKFSFISIYFSKIS